MNKVKFGIIGCGMIANWHIGAINLINNAQVVGVCDTKREYAESLALKHQVKVYDTIDDLLNDTEIDAVSICTPSGLHAPIIIKAANAKKHIVVEKPMAITKEQIEEVIHACEINKVKLCSISQLRFTKAIRQVKQAVESGELGKIVCGDIYMKYRRTPEYFANSSWRGTKAMDGGGALMNQGIHGIDLLQYIMGPIKSIYAKSKTLVHDIEVEDTASALVEYQNGAIGVIQATTSVYPGYLRRLEINGEKGSIVLIEDSIHKWEVNGKDIPADVVINGGTYKAASNPSDFSIDGHVAQISDMVDAIIKDRPPFVDQYEGRKPIDIILSIYESAKLNKPIEL